MVKVNLKSRFRELQSEWSLLTQGAAWVFSTVAVFLLPPPAVLHGGDTSLVNFAKFVTTVALSICLFIAGRYRLARARKGWVASATVFLLLSMCGFFLYQHFRDKWTANYLGDRIAIGDKLTEDGVNYLALPKNRGMSPDTIVWNATGNAGQIWTHDSIQSCWERLSILYVCLFPVVTACMVSVLQLSRKAESR